MISSKGLHRNFAKKEFNCAITHHSKIKQVCEPFSSSYSTSSDFRENDKEHSALSDGNGGHSGQAVCLTPIKKGRRLLPWERCLITVELNSSVQEPPHIMVWGRGNIALKIKLVMLNVIPEL